MSLMIGLTHVLSIGWYLVLFFEQETNCCESNWLTANSIDQEEWYVQWVYCIYWTQT